MDKPTRYKVSDEVKYYFNSADISFFKEAFNLFTEHFPGMDEYSLSCSKDYQGGHCIYLHIRETDKEIIGEIIMPSENER